MFIPKGVLIICPGCFTEIAVVPDDILYGQHLTSKMFRFVEREYVNGQACACFECGVQWFCHKKGALTDQGWFPRRH